MSNTVIGNSTKRATLRSVVYEHLPPDANRAEFTLDVRFIDDAKKPGAEELVLATQIGASLSEKSSSRADAILAGKLLALGVGGSAFTMRDVFSLRKHAAEKGEQGQDYEQLAKAIARWCDYED